MALEPNQRFSTVSEFVKALERCLHFRPAIRRVPALPPLKSALINFGRFLEDAKDDISETIPHNACSLDRFSPLDALQLTQSGLLRLVPDGFRLPLPDAQRHRFDSRNEIETVEKIGIALTTALLLQNSAVIALDGGTTTAWVARFLTLRDLQQFSHHSEIYTNNVIALRDVRHMKLDSEWYALGGKLRTGNSTIAEGVAESIKKRDLHVSAVVLGTNAIGVEDGRPYLGMTTKTEIPVKEELIRCAKEHVIIVANPSKLGAEFVQPLSEDVDLPALLRGRKRVTIVTAYPEPVYQDSSDSHADTALVGEQSYYRFLKQVEAFVSLNPGFTLSLYGIPIVPRLWGNLKRLAVVKTEDVSNVGMSVASRIKRFRDSLDNESVLTVVLNIDRRL